MPWMICKDRRITGAGPWQGRYKADFTYPWPPVRFTGLSSEWILMRGRRIAWDWRHQVRLAGVILLECNGQSFNGRRHSSASRVVDASGTRTSAAVDCLAAGRGRARLPVRTTFTRRVFGGRGAACVGRRRLGGCGVKRGEIRWYTFRLPDKRRPVLILTRNDVIDRLNEIIVIPATRTIRGLTTEVVLTCYLSETRWAEVRDALLIACAFRRSSD
jgi:hypothetical protein